MMKGVLTGVAATALVSGLVVYVLLRALNDDDWEGC